MYRVRREVFLREAGALDLDWPRTRVLDVGSGTGFYIQAWRDLGAGSVTGCDLTLAAVDRLRTRFPNVRFHRLDIAEPGDLLAEDGVFDVASCMDKLFHITDDARYVAALGSIASAVRPGGHFVLSENFVHRGVDRRGPNQANRTLEWITAALDEAGFDVIRRTPMLVLMNAQVDAGPGWRKLWGGALRAATVTEATGWLAGAALYPLERRLVRNPEREPHHRDHGLPPSLNADARTLADRVRARARRG